MCVPRLLAAATIRGRSLSRSRASDCAATIGGGRLFKEIRYAEMHLMHFYLEEEVGHVDVLYCKTFLAT